MVLGQASEQVGQDNPVQQRRKAVRSLRVQLPLYMRGLSVSVLLIAGSQAPRPRLEILQSVMMN